MLGITQPTIEDVSTRLRALRKSRGMSLADVEVASDGMIKAVVLGSYERGLRTLSVKRAIELAAFFSVPVSYLFTEPGIQQSSTAIGRTVIDLRKIPRDKFDEAPNSGAVKAFLAWIAVQRQDWNGEVMSLRNSDIALLGILTNKRENEVIAWLRVHDLLIEAPSRL